MAPNSVEIMVKHDSIAVLPNESSEDRIKRILPIAREACRAHERQVDALLQKIAVSPQHTQPKEPLYRPQPELFYTEIRLEFGNEDPSITEELKEFAARIRGEAVSDCYRDVNDCVAAQALIEAARRSALSEPPSIPIDVDSPS